MARIRSIAARAVRGSGWESLVRRVTIASGAVLAVALGTGILARGHLADSLFRGDQTFVWLLLGGLIGVWVMFVLRGVLSGERRFHAYGLMFVADATAKALPGFGFKVLSAKLGYKAKNPVSMASLSPEAQEEVHAFLAGIENNDDVQNLFVGLVD